jgi:hypothetical protein
MHLHPAIRRTRAALRRPSIPRTLLLQATIGVVLGLSAGAALLLDDAFGLRHLVDRSADLGAAGIFLASSITTMAPLVLATAIGLLADADAQPAQDRKPPS